MSAHPDPATGQPDRLDLAAVRDRLTVLGIAEGFFPSTVLFALVRLRIFERIGETDKALAELAAEVGARPETLARLLNAAVMLKLLETGDGSSYRASALARSVLLPSAGEAYLGDWIRNLSYLNLAMAQLDQAVLQSPPAFDPLTHLGNDAARTREFMLAMHTYAALYGRELAHYLDAEGCASLLDLGCGPGTYAFYLGRKNPALQLYLLDFAEVLEVAREVEARFALPNPIHYLAADAVRDEIPGQYDLVLVSNTLHQLGPEASAALLRRLYAAVKPGGSLVVQARFLRDDRLGDRVPVLLDLLELCITTVGRNHSVGRNPPVDGGRGLRQPGVPPHEPVQREQLPARLPARSGIKPRRLTAGIFVFHSFQRNTTKVSFSLHPKCVIFEEHNSLKPTSVLIRLRLLRPGSWKSPATRKFVNEISGRFELVTTAPRCGIKLMRGQTTDETSCSPVSSILYRHILLRAVLHHQSRHGRKLCLRRAMGFQQRDLACREHHPQL